MHSLRFPSLLAAAAITLIACGSSNNPTGSSSSGGASGGASAASSGSATGGANAASSGSASGDASSSNSGAGGGAASNRGFPDPGPWVSWYGGAKGVDLAKVASTFRIINIDADPDAGNFTDAEIKTLKASGKNRVISYLNVGSCENFRSYWSKDPQGFLSCQNTGALTTNYGGYPDEMWANLSVSAYHNLIVGYVAPRLAARGVDGFFLDNMEVVEHGANNKEGPCDSACKQGGLDLVWELRSKFPDMLIVMQNATSDVTRLGMTHGAPYPAVLDGISHEEVYSNGGDPGSLAEMKAWKQMGLMVNGRPFWLGTEDYVGGCDAASKNAANAIYAKAMADGFNEYVTDESGSQQAPCFWSDF